MVIDDYKAGYGRRVEGEPVKKMEEKASPSEGSIASPLTQREIAALSKPGFRRSAEELVTLGKLAQKHDLGEIPVSATVQPRQDEIEAARNTPAFQRTAEQNILLGGIETNPPTTPTEGTPPGPISMERTGGNAFKTQLEIVNERIQAQEAAEIEALRQRAKTETLGAEDQQRLNQAESTRIQNTPGVLRTAEDNTFLAAHQRETEDRARAEAEAARSKDEQRLSYLRQMEATEAVGDEEKAEILELETKLAPPPIQEVDTTAQAGADRQALDEARRTPGFQRTAEQRLLIAQFGETAQTTPELLDEEARLSRGRLITAAEVTTPTAEPITLTVAETEGAAALAEEAALSRGRLDIPTESAPVPAPEAEAAATPEAFPTYGELMASSDAEFMAFLYGLNEEMGFALLGQLNKEEGNQVNDRFERLFAEDELTPVEEVAPTDLSPTEPAEFVATYGAAQNAGADQVEDERAVAEAAEAEETEKAADEAEKGAAPFVPASGYTAADMGVTTSTRAEAAPVPEAGIATRFRGFLNRAWNGAVNYARTRLMPVEVRETVDGRQVTHWEAIAGYVFGGAIGAVETVLIQEWFPGAALLKGIANAALINGLNYGLREVYRRRREGAEDDTDRLVRLEREHKTAARFLRNAANGMATGVIVAGLTTAVIEAVHPGVFGHAATAGVVEQAPGVEHGTIADAARQAHEVATAPEGIADNVLHVDPKLGFWDENIMSSWFGGTEHFPNQENVARHILTKYWESGHAGQSFPTEALDMRFDSLPIQLQDALSKLYSANSLAEYVAAKPEIYPQLAEIGITFP